MDQIKIGNFIAACRKENNLTQAALAEKLGITDRAVSKWENGKSLPDSSIMLELCELLSININELLKGERIMDNREKESEELIISLKGYAEDQSKKLLSLEVILGALCAVACSALYGFGIYFLNSKEILFGNICLGIGTFVLISFAFAGVWIEAVAGYYKCSDCGYCHRPSFGKTLMAVHMGRSRKFVCPQCGKKNYHKKVAMK